MQRAYYDGFVAEELLQPGESTTAPAAPIHGRQVESAPVPALASADGTNETDPELGAMVDNLLAELEQTRKG